MDKASIVLRPALPTIEEGKAFARYLDQAAEGFFRLMLGRRSAEIIANAYLEPGHDMSHQHVTFAERDGVIVGATCGYTAEQHRQSSLAPMKRAIGRSPRAAVASVAMRPLTRIIDALDDGDYYLLAIAVDADRRGEGIGTTLLTSAEETARATGSTHFALHVSGSNATARRLYERHGLTIAWRWPKLVAVPGFTFYCMKKPL